MRIIEQGTPPEDTVHVGKCTRCKTIVEFKRSEARHHTHRNESYLSVTCPVCKYDTIAVEI